MNMYLRDSNNWQQHNAYPINEHVSQIPLTGTMTQKVRLNHTVVCRVIGIVFKFCQTHGTLHQRTSQFLCQYLGSEIYTTRSI